MDRRRKHARGLSYRLADQNAVSALDSWHCRRPEMLRHMEHDPRWSGKPLYRQALGAFFVKAGKNPSAKSKASKQEKSLANGFFPQLIFR
jgi:hypothetical protein